MHLHATSTVARRVSSRVNIAGYLTEMAACRGDQTAVVMPCGRSGTGYRYRSLTFSQLEEDSQRLAAGLIGYGLQPGDRVVLMVRPSIDFVALTFALFKAGAVIVLVDPGMGKANLLQCLQAVRPAGFVAIPVVQAARVLHRWRFPQAQLNVTVGRRWFWRGPTLHQLRLTDGRGFRPVATAADDPAAIIFTTGSTGPPKGVLYQHRTFDTQVRLIRDTYGIEPGGIDLAGFPLFGLFNVAMGVTTVIPDMDASRPASVDPRAIVSAVTDWKITQSFASPAVWNVVGRYCERHGVRLPSLRRVFSAGAPVPPHVLQRLQCCIAPDGEIHTPYGATEALPVASITGAEVLAETAARSANGAGTCVGRPFSEVEWRVIRISDDPLPGLTHSEPLPTGEIGELIVSGPMVTRAYVTREEFNSRAKLIDGDRIWHRMGDVGYVDQQDRFWYCGRLAHRVTTGQRTMFTIPCEAICNQHPAIYRSALVGVGPRDQQTPVMICEPWPDFWPQQPAARDKLRAELADRCAAHVLTAAIRPEHVLLHRSLPVDIRHNAKIFREQLAIWAANQIAAGRVVRGPGSRRGVA